MEPQIPHRRLEIRYAPWGAPRIGKAAIVIITVASAPASGIYIDIARIQIGRQRIIAVAGGRRLCRVAGRIHRHNYGRRLCGKAVDLPLCIDRTGIGAVSIVRSIQIGPRHNHRQGLIVNSRRSCAVAYAQLIIGIVVPIVDPFGLIKGQCREIHVIAGHQRAVVHRFRLLIGGFRFRCGRFPDGRCRFSLLQCFRCGRCGCLRHIRRRRFAGCRIPTSAQAQCHRCRESQRKQFHWFHTDCLHSLCRSTICIHYISIPFRRAIPFSAEPLTNWNGMASKYNAAFHFLLFCTRTIDEVKMFCYHTISLPWKEHDQWQI